MEVQAWSKFRAKQQTYLRRSPTESVLYRVIWEYRDELAVRWNDLFEHQYGVLRSGVLKAFDAFLNCGILLHGCARLYCPNCQHTELLAFSCKRRGLCPSCDAKRGLIFAEHLVRKILQPWPHRHVVFSLPKRLRVFFKFNRELCRILYRAAWASWSEMVNGVKQTGAVIALHTAGDLLGFHPHCHALMLDGWVDDEKVFHQALEVELLQLEITFTNKVLTALVAEELISEEVAIGIASQEHTGFHVWASEPIAATEQERLLFLARYLKRCPISLERLELVDNGLGLGVRITKKLDDAELHRELSPLEFLAEVSTHIPDLWEQTIRFFGAYSARTRGAENAAAQALAEPAARPISIPAEDYLPESLEEPQKTVSKQWSIWIKKIYEIDPLLCPKCNGEMKIIAFLHDSKVIKDICSSLGLQPWRAPPKISKTPIDTFCYDQTLE